MPPAILPPVRQLPPVRKLAGRRDPTTALQRLSPLSQLPRLRMARTLTLTASASTGREMLKLDDARVNMLALSRGGEDGRGLFRGWGRVWVGT
ncbi:hypothetical protein RSOL_508740 [Rhizoctonia solani AG-3 Rhs1AP]|uniref:Uncharacterized protein n=1 Tax=Rhizoctonia solani AG-3 Rhs1AP TaxID=1086054 RepID=X8JUD8_9AGAM|nr:hypothetical protein RSOL_508740 [Rhizoctonia solani AG-3 Rhs1AP]